LICLITWLLSTLQLYVTQFCSKYHAKCKEDHVTNSSRSRIFKIKLEVGFQTNSARHGFDLNFKGDVAIACSITLVVITSSLSLKVTWLWPSYVNTYFCDPLPRLFELGVQYLGCSPGGRQTVDCCHYLCQLYLAQTTVVQTGFGHSGLVSSLVRALAYSN
jgi:hypothetical protein